MKKRIQMSGPKSSIGKVAVLTAVSPEHSYHKRCTIALNVWTTLLWLKDY